VSDAASRQDEQARWSGSELVPAPLVPETAASVDPLEQRLVTGLAKIGLAARHRAWAEAEGRGLTPTGGQILALLRARGETGMRPSELADALAVRALTATLAAQALEHKGLARKSRGKGDGRVRTITLTEAGAAEAACAAGWADFLLTAIDALTSAEQRPFCAVCSR
jgi:DNA-binding MarR family transcriptional regulator